MYCHNKFIRGYLKSKDLNDTNEPQCSRAEERVCRKMPQQSEITARISLIKKKKEKNKDWNAIDTEGVSYKFRLSFKLLMLF